LKPIGRYRWPDKRVVATSLDTIATYSQIYRYNNDMPLCFQVVDLVEEDVGVGATTIGTTAGTITDGITAGTTLITAGTSNLSDYHYVSRL